MMMDDIFFEDPALCSICRKIYESGIMVWLNGQCLCPECYGRKNNEQQGIRTASGKKDR